MHSIQDAVCPPICTGFDAFTFACVWTLLWGLAIYDVVQVLKR